MAQDKTEKPQTAGPEQRARLKKIVALWEGTTFDGERRAAGATLLALLRRYPDLNRSSEIPDTLRSAIGLPAASALVSADDIPRVTVEPLTAIGRSLQNAETALNISLSDDQRFELTKLLTAIQQGVRMTVLAGYAGTGKTTLMRVVIWILRQTRDVIGAAPTGKAAARLRDLLSGLAPVLTVHGAIYEGFQIQGLCPTCDTWSADIMRRDPDRSNPWECPHCHLALYESGQVRTRMSFGGQREPVLPSGLFVVDESSMLAEAEVAQIEKVLPRDAQVLYVGDGGQLPPVMAKPGVDLIDNPTARLTTIHRQRAGDPILKWAKYLRTKQDKYPWDHFRGDARPIVHRVVAGDRGPAIWMSDQLRAGRDAILVTPSNETRSWLNDRIREILQFPKRWAPLNYGTNEAPQMGYALPFWRGEKILIQHNAHDWGLMNGEIVTVTASWWIYSTTYSCCVTTTVAQHPEFPIQVAFQIAERPDETFYAFADIMEKEDWCLSPGAVFSQRINDMNKRFNRHFKAWTEALDGVEASGEEPPDDATARALDARADGDSALLYQIFQEDQGIIPPSRFLHVTYGYSLTIHKSQGSQYEHVGIVWPPSAYKSWKGSDGYKLLYTAVTRASKEIVVWYLRKAQ